MDWSVVVGIKAVGSAIGSILAVAFQPPKTWRDMVIRTCFSFMAGMVFGDPLREQYLHWPERWEYWLASAALVSLISWAAYGAALRLIKAWKGPDK